MTTRFAYNNNAGTHQLKYDFLLRRLGVHLRPNKHLERYARALDAYEDIYETGGMCYASRIRSTFPEAWAILSCYHVERRVGNDNIDWDAIDAIVEAKMDQVVDECFERYTKPYALTFAGGEWDVLYRLRRY